MVYPKWASKPPLQTREQIERQIAWRGMTPNEQAALWECLFLTLWSTAVAALTVRHLLRDLPLHFPLVLQVFPDWGHAGVSQGEGPLSDLGEGEDVDEAPLRG